MDRLPSGEGNSKVMQALRPSPPGEEVHWLDALPAVQRFLLSTDGTQDAA
jgi:hypothetical protein